MDPHQNTPQRPLNVFDDTPVEGQMINAELKKRPGYEMEPLTGDAKVKIVEGAFKEMTDVKYTECAGSYGTIVTGTDPSSKKKVAVKLIPCKYKHVGYLELVHNRRVNREVHILRQLDHENILKLLAVKWGPMAQVLIQTEFLGQTLSKIVQVHKLQERIIVRMGLQLTKALLYLQAHNIVHHDIKPDNIMLVEFVDPEQDPTQVNQQLMDSNFKFVDFGCAKIYLVANPIEKNFRKGSPMFKSPEKLSSETYNANSSDLFGLAVCFLQAYIGIPDLVKFLNATPDVVDKPDLPNWLKVAQAKLPAKVGTSLEHLIFGLLKKESKRFNAKDAIEKLKLFDQ